MHSLAVLVAISLSSVCYGFIGPTANLYIRNKVIAPDGFNRSAVLAGGTANSVQFPGPNIFGLKGSTFRLNVIDQLTDLNMLTSTSIHWHGFFQKDSSWADGPVGVTQCPIAPGDSFLYRFKAENQAGTFWYHSHHSTQYCDGLRGAMVVYDVLDPHRLLYDFDDESHLICIFFRYHAYAPTAGLVPPPDATLINGKGRYAGGPTVPLTVIRVLPNKRYRFRLVSISCDPNYVFSIDGHSLTIIEVDSINVTPLTVDSIQIFAGQRYSFVLKTNQPISNYWIRANPNAGTTGFAGGLNSAILRYWGAPNADPATTSTVSNPLVETADVNLAINIAFDFPSLHFLVNGATFSPPTLPVLLQILSGTQTAQNLLPAGSVYTLPPNKVVELSFPMTTAAVGFPHPIHLHGHAFSVVRSAGSTEYNYANPVQRDVVSVGSPGDNVTIRFTTDNPGPWIMHCHIDWHLEIGLSVVFAEDVPHIATSNQPPAWDQLCPTYNALPPQVFPPP
ncbi:hypothetical protein CPC08DRAFT_824885 [Agrocybe pediades]|nr:hypothetical protein CPC08DRAFT_824885 [Agrocybe pediades]